MHLTIPITWKLNKNMAATRKQNEQPVKTTLLLMTALIAMAFVLPAKEKLLYGRWEIYKFQKAGSPERTKRKKFIVLHPDGHFSAGTIGNEPDKTGTWSYGKKGPTFSMQSEEGNKDDGDYHIEKLTPKELVLMRDSIVIYFEKVVQ